MAFITVYEEWREYGGPEEGGWYYDAWKPVENIRFHGGINTQKAIQVLNRVRVRYGFPPSYSKEFQDLRRFEDQNRFWKGGVKHFTHATVRGSRGRSLGSFVVEISHEPKTEGNNHSPYC